MISANHASRAAKWLFLGGLAIFTTGAFLAHAYQCQAHGLKVLAAGTVLTAASCLLLLVVAIMERSAKSGIRALAVGVLVAALAGLGGALTVAGCLTS